MFCVILVEDQTYARTAASEGNGADDRAERADPGLASGADARRRPIAAAEPRDIGPLPVGSADTDRILNRSQRMSVRRGDQRAELLFGRTAVHLRHHRLRRSGAFAEPLGG